MANLFTYSSSLFTLQYGLLLAGLVAKPVQYRRALWIPTAAVSIYLALYATVGNVNGDAFLRGSSILTTLTASDYLLLTDAQSELRHTHQIMPAHKLPLMSRIKWALHLLVSSRGVGWAHEPTAVLPPHPTTSRWAFVRNQLLWASIYFLVLHVVYMYTRQNPSFATGGTSVAAYGWIWRSINVLVIATNIAGHFSFFFCIVSGVSVGLGISNAQNWPHLFGYLGDAYTVRNFWGRTWHQLMRRFVCTHGKFLANKILQLRPTTSGPPIVQLYTAFFISGTMHCLMDYTMMRNWSGGSMRFFLLQAVVITFEAGLIAGAKRVGLVGCIPTWLWKILGCMWVWMWFTWCLPGWIDPHLSAGLMAADVNISVLLFN